MKLCNWNIEWMNHWFLSDTERPAWETGKEIDYIALAERVANVIKSIDPDMVTIQEGPSRKTEMKLFIDQCLNNYKIIGPGGKGRQKLYTLIKSDGEVSSVVKAAQNSEVDFSQSWAVDIEGNMELDEYDFTRQPQVLDVSLKDGREFQVINIHLKSKYVHNGKKLWKDPAQRKNFIIQALKARRRISAEAMRIREYLNTVLIQDPNKLVIVCGDFNDGPGTDYFERFYLTHNLVAVISGNPFHPQVMLRHGFINNTDASENYTAVFDDFVDDIMNRKVLLDHILVSPTLFELVSSGKVEHNAYEAELCTSLKGRAKYPSDHRPQSIVF